MNFSRICLSLAICVSGVSGFTRVSNIHVPPIATRRNRQSRANSCNLVLRARIKDGPDGLVDNDELMNLIHSQDCSCYSDHGVSSRTARIEIPLRAFAGVLAASNSALADDTEVSTEDPKSEMGNIEKKDPGEVNTLTEEEEEEEEKKIAEPPAAEESKPVAEEEKVVEEEKADEEEATSSDEPTKLESPVTEDLESKLLVEESKTAEQPNTARSSARKPKTFNEALAKYFSSALPTATVATKVENTLSQHKFTRGNTIFGTCVCPDEINNKPMKSLPYALQNALTDLNGAFQLGGLAGLPYLGVSGMKNFLSHTPKSGKVLIMYASHVGVTDDGVVGSVERLGRRDTTLDCDTTLNALSVAQSRIKTKNSESDGSSKVKSPDRREEYIVAKLRTALESNEASELSKEDLPAYATYQMFGLIQDQLMKQLRACANDGAWDGNIDEIVLLGGIIVNRGQLSGSIEPREDYFLPITFDSYSNSGSSGALPEANNLFHAAFGHKSTPFYAAR